MSEPIEPGLMNYAEAAAWLGVPLKWLQKKVQAGEAPHARLGKHVRFSQEHLKAIVAAGESTSNPQPAATPEPSKPHRPVVVGRRQRQKVTTP